MSVLGVIPCLDEAEHIGPLIDLMLRDPAIDRLVVADGGSTDGSIAIVRERIAEHGERLALLDNPARIQSAGVNRAVAHHGAAHEWLLRIDAHCVYPANYATRLLASAREHKADAVVVPMETVGTRGWQRAIAAAQNSALGTGGSPHRHVTGGRWVDHGHHALMRLDRFARLGGYCEAMPCNEDAELDVRQTEDGARIWLEPGAALTYLPRRTLGALWRQYRRYGTGRARTVRRHGIALKARQLAPLAVLGSVVALPLAFVHWVLALPATAWLAGCLLGGLVIGARAGGGMALASGVPAAAMHLAWGLGFAGEWLRGRRRDEPRYGMLGTAD